MQLRLIVLYGHLFYISVIMLIQDQLTGVRADVTPGTQVILDHVVSKATAVCQ